MTTDPSSPRTEPPPTVPRAPATRRRWLAIGAIAYSVIAVVLLWITRPHHQYCADGVFVATGEPWGYCGDAWVSEGAIVGTIGVVLCVTVLLVLLVRRASPGARGLLLVVGCLLIGAPIVGWVIGAGVDPFANGMPSP